MLGSLLIRYDVAGRDLVAFLAAEYPAGRVLMVNVQTNYPAQKCSVVEVCKDRPGYIKFAFENGRSTHETTLHCTAIER